MTTVRDRGCLLGTDLGRSSTSRLRRSYAPMRTIPMPEPTPTNLDATTTFCATCGRPVSMPHEHGDAPPTPTVNASDIALAGKWFRSSPGDLVSRKAAIASMAAEIAAAREAWGVPREAVAGLVEVATKALYHWNEGHDNDAGEVPGELRAALERVREGGSARE